MRDRAGDGPPHASGELGRVRLTCRERGTRHRQVGCMSRNGGLRGAIGWHCDRRVWDRGIDSVAPTTFPWIVVSVRNAT